MTTPPPSPTPAPEGAGAPSVRVLDADEPSWDRYLGAHPAATLYQTRAWAALVERVFGHRVLGLVAERDGRTTGVLPLFPVRAPVLGEKWISVPFDVGSGGPVASEEESERALLARAVELARGSRARYLELRPLRPLAGAAQLGFQVSSPVLVTRLEVAGEDEAWRAIAKHHQRSVKTAAKRGVTVRPARDLADVRAFWRIYLSTFRAFGTPPYPWSWWREVFERFHATGNAHLLLAEAEGELLGGMLLLGWHETLLMKFAVVLPESLPVRPYHALYWAAIRLAAARGHGELSWGSSAPAQTGLLEFKERWGGGSVPALFHDLPLRGTPPDIARYYDSEGLARRAWKRLPLPATALLGGPLNRWFC